MANRNKDKAVRAQRRRMRVRGKIHGTSELPRLTVVKSLKSMYVQIIDDTKHMTLLGMGTTSKAMAGIIGQKDTKTDQAKKLGQMVAQTALEKGITQVVFDRNRFRYHGRVKALADGARDKGLKC